jgi:hypothetical protein
MNAIMQQGSADPHGNDHVREQIDPQKRVSRRRAIPGLEFLTAVLALITAALGLFGYHQSQEKADAQAQVDRLQRDFEATRSRIAELNKQLDAAQAALASATASPSPSKVPGGPGVYHEGPLHLLNGSTADLDAPPSDRQWGVVSLPPGANPDITWQATNGLRRWNGSLALVPDGTRVTSSTCANMTGYGEEMLPTSSVKSGRYVCVFTDEERYSLVRIDGIDPNAAGVSLQVTTNQKPGD